jgi:hypothetical protein
MPTVAEPRMEDMPIASSEGRGESGSEGSSSSASRISALPTVHSTGSTGPGASIADVEQTIGILRARIDEEFRISERLDSKGRQLFTLAAGFFAAVQAVAFTALGNEHLAASSRVVLLAFTLVAAAVLVLVGHRLANSEEPLKESDIPPDDLVGWLESGENQEQVLLRLVGALSEVAKSRATNNATRKNRYDELQYIARWSLIASGAELLVAILVRL